MGRRGCAGGTVGLGSRAEVEFVLVVSGYQAVFHLGFTIGDLFHEVFLVGLALEVFGPVGVAEMCGAVQGTP
ncbi:hypothetical protein GT025_21605 [Streptomyces sp. SID4920]|nr:hypothetical protein [Streptomyces sp. SID4920]MYX69185.1 hypothetical protein [Streptomyces sp. SID8373]